MHDITACLWFDGVAEAAANFHVHVFPDSSITEIARYGDAGRGPTGGVMLVSSELDGRPFVGLNAGPQFTF